MLASGWTDWAFSLSDKGSCMSLNNNQFAGVFLPQPALGGCADGRMIILSGFPTSGSSKQNHWSVSYLTSIILMIAEPSSGQLPEESLNATITSMLQLIPLDSSNETSSTFFDAPIHPSTTTNESVDQPWLAYDISEVNHIQRRFFGHLVGQVYVMSVSCVDCVCICASEFHLLTHQISLRCHECTWRDLSSLQEVDLLSGESRRTCPGQEKKSRMHYPPQYGPFFSTLIVTAIRITQMHADPTGMLTVSPTSDGNIWTLALVAVAAVRWSLLSSIPVMPKSPSGQLPEILLNNAVTSSLLALLLVPIGNSWYRATFVPSPLVVVILTSNPLYWLINKSSREILPLIDWTSNEDIITILKGIDDAVRNLCYFQYLNYFHVLVVGELGSPSSSVVREISMIWTCLILVIMTVIITVMVLTPKQRCLDFHSPSARRKMQRRRRRRRRRRVAVCRHRGLSLSLSLLSLLAKCSSYRPLAVLMLPSVAIPLHSSRALTGTTGVF
jgi:hypothetical protein